MKTTILLIINGIWIKHKNYTDADYVHYCWDCVVKRNSKPDSLGRMMCKNCGGWYMPDRIPSGYGCLPGKNHQF